MEQDDPAALFWNIAEQLLAEKNISKGSLMGFPCLRVNSDFGRMITGDRTPPGTTGRIPRGISMKNLVAFLAILMTCLPLGAQERASRELTVADYTRAERTLGGHTSPMVFGASVRPTWVTGGRFWYRNAIVGGAEFVVVDADQATRARAFDHFGLSRALSSVTGVTYDGLDLPFTDFEFVDSGGSISFEVDGRDYVCDVRGQSCAEGAVIDILLSFDAIFFPYCPGRISRMSDIQKSTETLTNQER